MSGSLPYFARNASTNALHLAAADRPGKKLDCGVHARRRVAAPVRGTSANRPNRARRSAALRPACLICRDDQRAIGVIGDQHDAVGLGIAHAHQGRAEILLVRLEAFDCDDLGALVLGGLDEEVLAGAAPVGVEVQHGDLLEAERRSRIWRADGCSSAWLTRLLHM